MFQPPVDIDGEDPTTGSGWTQLFRQLRRRAVNSGPGKAEPDGGDCEPFTETIVMAMRCCGVDS